MNASTHTHTSQNYNYAQMNTSNNMLLHIMIFIIAAHVALYITLHKYYYLCRPLHRGTLYCYLKDITLIPYAIYAVSMR